LGCFRRTYAIGTLGGALTDVPLADLATTAVRAALECSGVPPELVEHVILGNVIPTEPRDTYRPASQDSCACLAAGLPQGRISERCCCASCSADRISVRRRVTMTGVACTATTIAATVRPEMLRTGTEIDMLPISTS
jgi:acetyl-CoA acetyltransferase